MKEYSAAAKRFYNSKVWKNCRASYIAERIKINGGMCETCHEMPGYIVHHKEEINESNINNPEITLNHKNLKYDCLICHNKENKEGQEITAEGLMFTEDGQLVRKK